MRHIDTLKEGFLLRHIGVPSRELTYPTWEREIIFKSAFSGGYVSFLESTSPRTKPPPFWGDQSLGLVHYDLPTIYPFYDCIYGFNKFLEVETYQTLKFNPCFFWFWGHLRNTYRNGDSPGSLPTSGVTSGDTL